MALFQDLRYAVRTLRKSPAFSVTAIAALALGIGATTAIFSVLDTVILKPLAYPDPDRIVLFFQVSGAGPVYGGSATRYNVWRHAPGFRDAAAYEYRGAGLTLTAGPNPEQVRAIRVSAGYFRLLGAPMAAGRTFTADEDRPNGPHVAILSYGLWQRRFGGDRASVGRAISLGGRPYTVVGIAGRSFRTELDEPPDIWLPFQIDPESSDHAQYFNVIARLAPGVSLAAANAGLEFAAAEFRRRFPDMLGPRDSFRAEPFQDSLVSGARTPLAVLGVAVTFVLLIACANVANLLLVRATGRRREIALRAAIGAGRGRIVRQLLTESLVLAAAGGALGLFLGAAGVRAILSLNPGDIPRLGENALTLDTRLVVFTVLISAVTGMLFGLAPALGVSRGDLAAALKEGGSRSGTGPRENRIRSLLVAGEIALALILLAGAALLLRTFQVLRAVHPGLDPHHVLTLRTSLAGSRFETAAAVDQLIRDGTARLEALPGVAAAAAGYNLPIEGPFGVPYRIAGHTPANGKYDGRGWTGISPRYFDAFRIPVLRGRAFTARDDAGASRVAIINQAMARRFWPAGDPLGERVILGEGYGPEFAEPARQIVGIVGDVHDSGLNVDPIPMVYVPMAQVTDGITALAGRAASLAWIARTAGAHDALRAAIAKEVEQASGGLGVSALRSMDEVVAQSTTRESFQMTLLGVFAAVALLLAVIGIYGLMAWSAELRSREFAVRMALGADPAAVRNLVLRQGLRLAAAGLAAGLLSALALTRYLSGLLFGVKAWDPQVFTVVPLLLGTAAAAAAWIPARRAARTDPARALRAE